MKEELQNALTEILRGVLSAKDFVLAELPEVVTQLLTWKMYESIIWFIFGIISIIIVIVVNCKTFKQSWKITVEVGAPAILANIIGSVIALIAISSIMNLDWLQITVAPKVYLIEYVASLAK